MKCLSPVKLNSEDITNEGQTKEDQDYALAEVLSMVSSAVYFDRNMGQREMEENKLEADKSKNENLVNVTTLLSSGHLYYSFK